MSTTPRDSSSRASQQQQQATATSAAAASASASGTPRHRSGFGVGTRGMHHLNDQSRNAAASSSSSSLSGSNSPMGDSTRRSRKKKEEEEYVKKHSEVSQTLSFDPTSIVHRRRQMCARRGDWGSEAVLAEGKAVFDSPPRNRSAFSSPTTPQRNFSVKAFNDTAGNEGRDTPTKPENLVSLAPVDAPSPLDRLTLSPLKKLAPSKEEIERKQALKDIRRERLAAEGKLDEKGELIDSDDEEEEEEDEDYDGEEDDFGDPFQMNPNSFRVPDWRVLCKKELYEREKDKLQMIHDRYNVTEKPEKKYGRRRSSVAGSSGGGRSVLGGGRRASSVRH